MVKEVQIIFPVRNHKSFACRHSFLSSGKVVNKHYYRYKQRRVQQGFEDFGTIRRLGEDWQVYDLEKLSDVYNEVPGIRSSANIFIKRYQSRKGEVGTKIRCSSHYIFDSGQEFRSLVKKPKARRRSNISLYTSSGEQDNRRKDRGCDVIAYNQFQRKLDSTSGSEMVPECNRCFFDSWRSQ
ncbi:hypothetical protein AVEN_265157-1 [Araneus ventricosus]|uniref:Uncharacterized protein n=1 Tax=Araneus ventricosus TaxID=182803 RepID=A0A4Y2UCH3_ARAVE|nr:hypothetical protein AVEN_265157-1 [Araneus ventricosus]